MLAICSCQPNQTYMYIMLNQNLSIFFGWIFYFFCFKQIFDCACLWKGQLKESTCISQRTVSMMNQIHYASIILFLVWFFLKHSLEVNQLGQLVLNHQSCNLSTVVTSLGDLVDIWTPWNNKMFQWWIWSMWLQQKLYCPKTKFYTIPGGETNWAIIGL